MNTENHPQTRWSHVGAVTAAVAASICCVGPLVAVALGVGGAWATRMAALEPYRPALIGVTVALLGLAFYREYRKPCVDGCSRARSRVALWIVPAFVLAVLAVPYVTPYLSSARPINAAPTTQPGCCPVPPSQGSK